MNMLVNIYVYLVRGVQTYLDPLTTTYHSHQLNEHPARNDWNYFSHTYTLILHKYVFHTDI